MKTCIVVPCYNEEKRIHIDAFKEYLLVHDNISLCFINDGSIDTTINILDNIKSFFPNRVIVFDLKQNQGKAEAIRFAVNSLNTKDEFDFIGFIDADLAAPLQEIDNLLIAGMQNHKVIIGSRFKRMGANINRSPFRHYLGRVFATFASTLLRLPIYDTQCGLKLFENEISKKIFKDPFISKWLFDVELFARIIGRYGRKFAMEYIFEVPLLQWEDKKGSKIKLGFFLKAPFDLMKIYIKYYQALKNK